MKKNTYKKNIQAIPAVLDLHQNPIKKKSAGFTLVELLIVISIIGILSGVILVDSGSGVEKSRRASAVTTVTSVLTELATCADDGGEVKTGDITVGGNVCCTTNACTAELPGHTIDWPNINTSTGWSYKAGGTSGDLASGDYIFTISKTGQTDVVCDFANSVCE